MPRRNNRKSKSPRPGSLAAVERNVPERTERRSLTAREKYANRLAKYEKYGTPDERRPYLVTSLGRPLSEASLSAMAGLFRTIASRKVIRGTGIVFAPGTELAKRNNYGLTPSGERKTAEEVVDDELGNLIINGQVPATYGQPIETPVKALYIKKWGVEGARVVAEVGDQPTMSDAAPLGQILAERAAIASPLSPRQMPSLSQENYGDISHRIDLLTFHGEERPYAETVIADIEVDEIHVCLAPIGVVNTPLPWS